MRIVVAGSSGFVGRRLCPALVEAGHDVVAMTRHPERYHGAGRAVGADVHDAASLDAALSGADAAYYLVHSLDDPQFRRKDAEGATAFARAAGEQGLRRIVYLGGLGDDADNLSTHLRSRREVEHLLGTGGVPVTTLRAGIIVGHGGISWEMTRQLVEHLPAMITPRWVRTRTQPIAVADVVRYLVGVLEAPVQGSVAFDIGGPDVLEYVEMMRVVSRIEGRTMIVVPVPLLTPSLSSRWLSLVTSVDVQTGRNLIDSMSNEVVVRDDSIRRLVPFEPMDYVDSVLRALGERARA
ncbi:MAG: NAD(P)H-binding protein [Actinomycetota bacterium]